MHREPVVRKSYHAEPVIRKSYIPAPVERVEESYLPETSNIYIFYNGFLIIRRLCELLRTETPREDCIRAAQTPKLHNELCKGT